MKKKITHKVLLTFTFVLFVLPLCWAQSNNPLPKDHPVNTAAAHLPTILQHDGMFNGLKYSVYITDQDKDALNAWAKNYPEELKMYKAAVTNYLNSVKVEDLAANEQMFYEDLQSQLTLLKTLNS